MTRRLGLLAAAATGVQVGAAMVATRPLLDHLGPATIAAMRYAIGLAVLTPFVLRGPRATIAVRDVGPLLVLGVGQFGVLIWLLNVGLQDVSAALGALLFAVFPLLTLLGAAAMGRERLTAAAVGGALLCLSGLAVTLGVGGHLGVGAMAILAAAAVGAACALGYRPYLARYPTLAVGWRAIAAAVCALAPLALLEGGAGALSGLGPREWGLLAFVGVASGAGYMIWLTALRHAPASEATLLLSLSPLVALVLDVALLGEMPGAGVLLGLPLILAGLGLALRPGRR